MLHYTLKEGICGGETQRGAGRRPAVAAERAEQALEVGDGADRWVGRLAAGREGKEGELDHRGYWVTPRKNGPSEKQGQWPARDLGQKRKGPTSWVK